MRLKRNFCGTLCQPPDWLGLSTFKYLFLRFSSINSCVLNKKSWDFSKKYFVMFVSPIQAYGNKFSYQTGLVFFSLFLLVFEKFLQDHTHVGANEFFFIRSPFSLKKNKVYFRFTKIANVFFLTRGLA